MAKSSGGTRSTMAKTAGGTHKDMEIIIKAEYDWKTKKDRNYGKRKWQHIK